MSEADSSWDVIVVGAGLGGLSAAARLSQMGLRPLVLEQQPVAGGYAHRFLRKVRGTKIVYYFDVALHQVGDLEPGRPMHRWLSDLGVLDRLQLNRFDVAYRSIGPAHDIEVPADADAYEARLCEIYPEHARGVRDLFASMRKIVEMEDGELSPEAAEAMSLTLQELVDRHIRDERINAIFCALWGYLGSPPSQVSAFLFAQMWASYHLGGCFYIKGGGQSLANAFVEVIEGNRGEVLLRTDVAKILTEGGRVCGVETTKGRLLRAPVVVSNAAAPLTFHQLLDRPDLAAGDWPTRSRSRSPSARPTSGCAATPRSSDSPTGGDSSTRTTTSTHSGKHCSAATTGSAASPSATTTSPTPTIIRRIAPSSTRRCSPTEGCGRTSMKRPTARRNGRRRRT